MTRNHEGELFDMRNPFSAEASRLRLLESGDVSPAKLCEQILDGSYGKPFILEDGRVRYLHLGIAHVQSIMRIDQPDALDLRYTQKMMGFLIFHPAPRRITLIGLGGGSLAKYCYRHLPLAAIEVVEIDPHVIALRQHFMIPDDDHRFKVICADGTRHLAAARQAADVLLVDAFDDSGLADGFGEFAFLDSVHDFLADDGVLVMNLAGERSRFQALVGHARARFGDRFRVVSVRGRGNFVLYAFKRPAFDPDWNQLRSQARKLRQHYRLDFPKLVQKLEHVSRNGGVTRELLC
ncbi:MAG TPA: fused MFS/spermidine synthase [Rhodocyclaceae bacterium]|nr:fused MFS/spermidine synthase [Rhodocyclaceae bacterium]